MFLKYFTATYLLLLYVSVKVSNHDLILLPLLLLLLYIQSLQQYPLVGQDAVVPDSEYDEGLVSSPSILEPDYLELQQTGAAEVIMADLNNSVSNKNAPLCLTLIYLTYVLFI